MEDDGNETNYALFIDSAAWDDFLLEEKHELVRYLQSRNVETYIARRSLSLLISHFSAMFMFLFEGRVLG